MSASSSRPGVARRAVLGAPLSLLLAPAHLRAQSFPERPLRLVVPFAAGGGGDALGRILADKLKARLNQNVVVDNRPGASGIIGSDIVAKAPADGHTLLLNTPNLVMTQHMGTRLPYNPLVDLVPVAEVVRAQLWLAVSTARSDARTLQEFVAQAKRQPEVFYGSVAAGSAGHLLAFGFSEAAGLKASHVPYKGGAPASMALAAGEISFAVMDWIVLKPQLDAGKVRVLGTFGASRSAHSPDTPTLTQAGYPGLEIYSWAGLFVPAGTPPTTLRRLADEARVVMADPEVVARFVALGYDPGKLLMDDFAQMVRSDDERWSVIIRKAGVKLN